MKNPVTAFGEIVMAEPKENALAIDWRVALLGGLVALGILATTLTAFFEGLPWETKSEQAANDRLTSARLDALISAQTANAGAINSLSSQVSTVTNDVSQLTIREQDDRRDIDDLMNRKRMGALKQQLKEQLKAKDLAAKKDRDSYDRQMKAMERGFITKQSVGL